MSEKRENYDRYREWNRNDETPEGDLILIEDCCIPSLNYNLTKV